MTLAEMMGAKAARDAATYARLLPPIRHMDTGTREGRRALLRMARRALREAREAFSVGLFEDALDALVHAAKIKSGLERYYRMRRTILADPRYNVCGPRPW